MDEPRMNIEEFSEWLGQVYETISEKAEDSDEDPYEAWQKFVDDLDPDHGEISVGMHWGTGGIMELVDWLRDKVNDGEGNEFVVDNPASEGSSDWSLYSFTRRQLVRAAVVRDVLKALQADDKAARASEG